MKQIAEYIAAIVLWCLGAVLWIKQITCILFIGLAVLHFVEMITVGYRTGRKYGQTWWHCVISCMLFGFLWWLPLYRRMKYDDLEEEDFIDDGREPWRETF